LIDAHGGEFGSESTPGKGSRFFFTLPLAQRVERSRSRICA